MDILGFAVVLFLGFGLAIAGGIRNWRWMEWSGWAISLIGIGLGLVAYFIPIW